MYNQFDPSSFMWHSGDWPLSRQLLKRPPGTQRSSKHKGNAQQVRLFRLKLDFYVSFWWLFFGRNSGPYKSSYYASGTLVFEILKALETYGIVKNDLFKRRPGRCVVLSSLQSYIFDYFNQENTLNLIFSQNSNYARCLLSRVKWKIRCSKN